MGEATLGNYDEAIETIRQLIRRSPLHTWAWIDLAVWLSRTGRMDDARNAAVQAKLIHPG
jgi:Flp pilus assembly protein TadD